MLKWTVHTLIPITHSTFLSTHHVLMSPFDDHRTKCLVGHRRISPFLLYVGFCVSPLLFLDITLLRLRSCPILASRAAILASLLVCFTAELMPYGSQSLQTCICFFLVIEFQTALWYFLHSTFSVKTATLGLTG